MNKSFAWGRCVAEQVDELRSRGLQRQAEAAYQLGSELLKSARAAQIEYGRWLVNTLWLMPPGTLVGFPSRRTLVSIPILLWSTVLVCGWYRFRFRRSIRGLVEFHLRDRAIPSPDRH